MPRQVYWLCSGSFWGVTVYFSEGSILIGWSSLNLLNFCMFESSERWEYTQYTERIQKTLPCSFNWCFWCALPCVVPSVLTFLHPTLEHQAVRGEDLWPTSQQDYRSLWALCRNTIKGVTNTLNTYTKLWAGRNKNAPCTSSLTTWLWSEWRTAWLPLLVWHLYDPVFFVPTEVMV